MEERCPYYSSCGFVKFLKERVNLDAKPLREGDPCGIEITNCPRIEGSIPLNFALPANYDEMVAAFPAKPNDNGRRQRRIAGGAHR